MSTITLAPMEGVVDYLLRELLTEAGGIDLCVTEFIRITDTRLPTQTFHRICPELKHGCRTRGGTPVHIQFLGNNPEMLAYNAAKAARLGALGIDLNFGCPAKTVNRHKGGAVLLKEPELIHEIVSAVREAVPADIPVSAKMRLGYLDSDLALENARAIESAGANSVVVHARTKLQGYKPPAHWQELVHLRENLSIPLVANGDIFTIEDAHRCREVSGCQNIMIGRGILRDPDLPAAIVASQNTQCMDERWARSLSLIKRFTEKVVTAPETPEQEHPYFINNPRRYLDGRLKQWLSMMSKSSANAQVLFDKVKRETCLQTLSQIIQKAS
ncbi:tRNA dihydrouridine synthase [Endozoicomonas arenosclerae]|uniref:tRNA dihydrouridine synthase n=1 Tax=Endozoicomonas arenosclerae TaxID=1633495 RepID=UPI000A416D6D|nr:tRNA-dihydrouridine synthase [Endozoicomonas arenosclerae]